MVPFKYRKISTSKGGKLRYDCNKTWDIRVFSMKISCRDLMMEMATSKSVYPKKNISYINQGPPRNL